jgi:hypothetical protein
MKNFTKSNMHGIQLIQYKFQTSIGNHVHSLDIVTGLDNYEEMSISLVVGW